jgi:hypothetical protein
MRCDEYPQYVVMHAMHYDVLRMRIASIGSGRGLLYIEIKFCVRIHARLVFHHRCCGACLLHLTICEEDPQEPQHEYLMGMRQTMNVHSMSDIACVCLGCFYNLEHIFGPILRTVDG